MSVTKSAKQIAVMTDVHANLPALETALAAIRDLECDSIVHTGDAVGIGPYPRETLERLLAEESLRLVMGNHDWWYANGLPEAMSEGEATHQRWVHGQLGSELKSTVASWPWLIQEPYGCFRVAFMHYGLRQEGAGFVEIAKQPTSETLDTVFRDVTADLVFYGHHHPVAEHTGRARYINPGSLGCFIVPEARFAILEIEPDGSFQITKHAIPYDWTDYFRQMDLREVPERRFIRTTFFAQPNE